MLSPEVLLTFFAASLLLGIAPGPDNIFVLTQSAVYGVRAGLVTTLGLVTGLCVHTTAVALGVAAIFQTSPLAFTILKCAGAAYLLYLAWMSFRAGALLAHTPGGGAAFPGYAALYRRGIVMNVTNPKVTLFFLAFLPQFCNPALGGVVVQVLTLGTLFMRIAGGRGHASPPGRYGRQGAWPLKNEKTSFMFRLCLVLGPASSAACLWQGSAVSSFPIKTGPPGLEA